jgi:hypothetical protein
MPGKVKIARLCLLICGGLKMATAALFLFIVVAGSVLVGWRGERSGLLGNAVLGALGIELFAASAVLGVFDLVTAAGVRRRSNWARFLGIFLGVLMLPLVPVGTVLGLFVLTGLLDGGARAWFSGGRV